MKKINLEDINYLKTSISIRFRCYGLVEIKEIFSQVPILSLNRPLIDASPEALEFTDELVRSSWIEPMKGEVIYEYHWY